MEDRLLRVEKAIENMANAITKLTEAIGDVIKDNAVRNERDKYQQEKHEELSLGVAAMGEKMESDAAEINKKVNAFIESYKEQDKPVIDTARKMQGWFFWWLTRVIAPVILGAILLSAGAKLYDTASEKQKIVKSGS